jgi:CheY-like chemotaxis protein
MADDASGDDPTDALEGPLGESEERLRTADRMDSLGTLAAGIAHEINNPLTYVMGNFQLVRERVEEALGSEADLADAMDDVMHGLDRIRSLVLDLRTFSFAGHDSIGPVSLTQIIETTLRIAASELERRANLVYEPRELPPITGNASQVGQVVLDLLSDATDAIEPSSNPDQRVCIETSFDADTVRLSVSGTGTASFPRWLSDADAILDEAGDTDGAFRPARILVIEDDERVGRVTSRALEGHDVTTLKDPREALAVLLSTDEFELVVCDVMMEDLDGIQLYAAVAEQIESRAQRFVFMTGAAVGGEGLEFIERTGLPLLQKPFLPLELRRFVETRLRALRRG